MAIIIDTPFFSAGSISTTIEAKNYQDFLSDPSAPISAAGEVRLRNNAGVFEVSQNGGAYTTISGGSIILAPIGSSPNANAATLVGSTLNLEPASSLFPGIVTATGLQSFGGYKFFDNETVFNGAVVSNGGLWSTGYLTLVEESGSVAAATTITPIKANYRFTLSSAHVTMTATPSLYNPPGFAGRIQALTNNPTSTFNLILQDEAVLPGSGMSLGATTRTILPGQSMFFVLGSDLKWRHMLTTNEVAGGGGGVTTMAAVGSSPNANAATISGTILTLQPAGSGFPGVMTAGTQTFAGAKTFQNDTTFGTSTVTSSFQGLLSDPAAPISPVGGVRLRNNAGVFEISQNGGAYAPVSGGGVTTLAAVGSSPNANAGTISGATLNLQPASASFPGVVTTGTQTFAGAKTFNNDATFSTSTTTSSFQGLLSDPAAPVSSAGGVRIRSNAGVFEASQNGGAYTPVSVIPTLTHVRARRYLTTQSIPPTTPTIIIYDTEDYDTLGEYNNTTGIFTATVAGYYSITASVALTNLTSTFDTVRWLDIVRNAEAIARSNVYVLQGGEIYSGYDGSSGCVLVASTTVSLIPGDTVQAKAANSGDASENTTLTSCTNYICIDRLL